MTNPDVPTPEGLPPFQIVVAVCKNNGIGKTGKLPWSLPGDMKFFRELTSKTSSKKKENAVIMGRKTWESIPEKFRPLPGRLNVVISRSIDKDTLPDSVQLETGLLEAFRGLASKEEALEHIFVIGGGQLYQEAIKMPNCEALHITEIAEEIDCDTFFPKVDETVYRLYSSSPRKREKGYEYTFNCYVRRPSSGPIDVVPDSVQASGAVDPNWLSIRSLPQSVLKTHQEYQYLDLIREILDSGDCREDRTGVGTRSKFGAQMRYDLSQSFPLLTTKRVFWRGVVEELLWFMSGCTDARKLADKNVHIWDANGSREFLDSRGLYQRQEMDLGPVYGFQWRHFGAKYQDFNTDYTGQGVDQLAQVIQAIKTNPTDRRIILSAWNPAALPEMALPPCHMFAQFYVSQGRLSCQMYQRSADMGLGVPFNIASYSLLTCILAHVCDLHPGEFIHVIGDAHVYTNHEEPLERQLQNKPRPFPKLEINTENKDIDKFRTEDFEIKYYQPHKKIDMKMAV